MKDLIAKLEAATEGSRELDVGISGAIGWAINDDGLWANASHPTRLRAQIPGNFTRSIDAALPGENIVYAEKSMTEDGKWLARQLMDDGTALGAYGHTEALARRIAALKARDH